MVTSGGSRISQTGGCQPMSLKQNSFIFQNFCRKLHENERNWTRRSMDPLMVMHLFDFVSRGRWIHRRPRRSGRCTSPSRCRTSILEPRSAAPPCASSPPGRAKTILSKYVMVHLDSSFPVIHKVGNVDIFILLKFGNKMDTEISHFN